jgi:hypothetical protein
MPEQRFRQDDLPLCVTRRPVYFIEQFLNTFFSAMTMPDVFLSHIDVDLPWLLPRQRVCLPGPSPPPLSRSLSRHGQMDRVYI